MVVAAVCVACFVYARLLAAPFLGWDDDHNIVLNPAVRDAAFGAIWAAPWFGLYVPVTSTLWAVLWKLDGGSAVAFRISNLLLHAVTTVLVWRLLVQAGRGRGVYARDRDRPAESAGGHPGGVPVEVAAAIGATVFALHPLQTAAVGWISGGRDLLATCLAVAALLVWMRGRALTAGLSTGLFLLALLSKPSVAAVPLAVIAGAAVIGATALRRVLPAMLGWLGLSLGVALVTSLVQTEMTQLTFSADTRALAAVDALGFYLLKIVLPVRMAADYGRTPEALVAHPRLLIPTFIAVLIVATVLVRPVMRRQPVAIWVAAFAGLLLPVLGLVPFAYQRISTVADHYAFLPMVAIGGVVMWFVATRVRRTGVAWAVWLFVVAAGGVLSWERLAVWRDDGEFFAAMVKGNPESFSGLTNLAKLSCDRGDARTGAALAARALGVNGANPATLAVRADCLYRSADYGVVVAMRGRMRNAQVQFALSHDDAAAASFLNTIAGAWFQTGRMELGAAYLCQASAIRPRDGYLRANLRDISDLFARRGIVFSCGRRLSWEELGRLDDSGRSQTIAPDAPGRPGTRSF